MNNVQKIAEDIYWTGGSDRRLSRFENLFPLPRGVSYNSYAVMDEKIALFDTADVSIADQYLENVRTLLKDRKPDYLILLHMEPDHGSQIGAIAARYPDITLVGNAKTFTFLHQFFPELSDLKKLEVKDGETLSTGKHVFHFVTAPMVHWPEVLMAYDETTGALFSADAFGTFGAVDNALFADECDFETEFLEDARRYYANIVGKYGAQVQAVLKKAAGFEIRMLCALHGPIWRSNIAWFLDKYQKWSTYEPEEDAILVIYGSLYGHTASAAEAAAACMRQMSGKRISVYDVSETHASYLISEIWRCRTIVLFSPTYNAGIYLPMDALLHEMAAVGVQNRTFALAQNGTWAPASGKLMAERLSALKNVKVLDNVLTIKSALHETDREALEKFAGAVVNA